MKPNQKALLLEAFGRICWYSAQLQTMEDKLGESVLNIAETGVITYDEESIFGQDVAKLDALWCEIGVLVRTAENLEKRFQAYAFEGFEDYAKKS